MLLIFLGNTDAFVGYADAKAAASGPQLDKDLRIFRGEFHGVGHQVDHYILEQFLIRREAARSLIVYLNLLTRLKDRPDFIHQVFDEFGDDELIPLRMDLTLFQFAKGEEVLE